MGKEEEERSRRKKKEKKKGGAVASVERSEEVALSLNFVTMRKHDHSRLCAILYLLRFQCIACSCSSHNFMYVCN